MKNKIFVLLVFLFTLNSCSLLFGKRSSETIHNPKAREYYSQAQKQLRSGGGGMQESIKLLNKADSLEPNNPIILHERGLTKFNSKSNREEAFKDLQLSIDYTVNERDKQIRYLNRGICYMEIKRMDKACDDWAKAGKSGKGYIEKYCQ